MLVATAGHIDHGKTTLVRALTGVDTDRLPEERQRGISIDIGFAYWTTADGETIGFVDVPGHERFVRNMLAGVGGVDFALVVVAADDSVMPQTIEHIQILNLLGLVRGAVAITKCDRASREQIDKVRREVVALLAPTGLAGALVFEVSAASGDGIPALSAALRKSAAMRTPHDGRRNFRLTIDRAFSVPGTGTVVTGTVIDGAVGIGAKLIVSPAGRVVRVRGLQSAGQQVAYIEAGRRCALNLTGVEVADIGRGDWLLVPEMHAPTTRIEARVRVLDDRNVALAHASPVHLHIGTAGIPSRVLMPRRAGVPPGADAVVRLILDQPVSAIVGDRFVLRDHSGRQLIGGGRVVDPFAPNDRRRDADRLPVTAALEQSEPENVLSALFAIPGHEVDTRRFAQAFNFVTDAAEELYRTSNAVLLGRGRTLALPVDRVVKLGDQVIAALEAFHREQPEIPGIPTRELRARLTTQVSADALAALLKEMAEQRRIELGGSLAKLPGHAKTLTPTDSALWNRLLPWLDELGPKPFTLATVMAELRTSEGSAKALLYRRRINGDVWQITSTRYMMREQVAMLAETAATLDAALGDQGFTAAQFRDAAGVGRNLVIQILEFFDRVGITRRRADRRTMAADYCDMLGVAGARKLAG